MIDSTKTQTIAVLEMVRLALVLGFVLFWLIIAAFSGYAWWSLNRFQVEWCQMFWIEQVGQTGNFVSNIGRMRGIQHFEFVDNDNVRLDRLDNSIDQVELNLALLSSLSTKHEIEMRCSCPFVVAHFKKQNKRKTYIVDLTVVILLS